MAQSPPKAGNLSATIWSIVFAACLLLAAAHLVSATLEQAQQETTLIEDTFTRASGGS